MWLDCYQKFSNLHLVNWNLQSDEWENPPPWAFRDSPVQLFASSPGQHQLFWVCQKSQPKPFWMVARPRVAVELLGQAIYHSHWCNDWGDLELCPLMDDQHNDNKSTIENLQVECSKDPNGRNSWTIASKSSLVSSGGGERELVEVALPWEIDWVSIWCDNINALTCHWHFRHSRDINILITIYHIMVRPQVQVFVYGQKVLIISLSWGELIWNSLVDIHGEWHVRYSPGMAWNISGWLDATESSSKPSSGPR